MCTWFFFKIGINRDGLDPSCSNLLQRDKTMYTHNYYLVTNVVNIYLDNVYIMYVHLFGFFFQNRHFSSYRFIYVTLYNMACHTEETFPRKPQYFQCSSRFVLITNILDDVIHLFYRIL